MNKKAIILDLDNTIYPVPAIGEKLFKPLFALIEETGDHEKEMDKIRYDIMRKPFQVVAKTYLFDEALTEKGINLLKDISYDDPIEPFTDYEVTRQLPVEKFLVTTGFLKMQQSKIKAMNIGQHFKEVYIIDPMTSSKTKKDVFAEIMNTNAYHAGELLVIGDDASSEIKAATELGIDSVLYDKNKDLPSGRATYNISSFEALEPLLQLL